MGTYGLSYGDLWKQSTEAEFPDPAGCFCLEKSPRVEMGPCTEPARSTSRAQLPPRPTTSPSLGASVPAPNAEQRTPSTIIKSTGDLVRGALGPGMALTVEGEEWRSAAADFLRPHRAAPGRAASNARGRMHLAREDLADSFMDATWGKTSVFFSECD